MTNIAASTTRTLNDDANTVGRDDDAWELSDDRRMHGAVNESNIGGV